MWVAPSVGCVWWWMLVVESRWGERSGHVSGAICWMRAALHYTSEAPYLLCRDSRVDGGGRVARG